MYYNISNSAYKIKKRWQLTGHFQLKSAKTYLAEWKSRSQCGNFFFHSLTTECCQQLFYKQSGCIVPLHSILKSCMHLLSSLFEIYWKYSRVDPNPCLCTHLNSRLN